jgi:predicted RNA-binding Zn-ribbon protein involved in translation (DUF1610 family)
MSRLSARLDRIAGPRRCPECGFPGPLPRDIEVKTVVRVTELDEEGRPLPTPPAEPEYCESCGRPMPVIRMQPLDEKSRGT